MVLGLLGPFSSVSNKPADPRVQKNCNVKFGWLKRKVEYTKLITHIRNILKRDFTYQIIENVLTIIQSYPPSNGNKNDVMRLGERPRSLEGKPNKPKLHVLRFEVLLF